jgi:outer membrane murein-binding lipoprotein Lpp
MRGAGLLILGLGLGLGAGYLAGDNGGSPALVWLALGLVVLSSVLLALGPRAARAPDPQSESARDAADLGTRVEQILRLAEEQAADRIRSAEDEAGRIVAEARARPDQLPD